MNMDFAYQSARQAIESTYIGTCTITEYKKVKDLKTKLTQMQEVVVLKDKPCRVSYNTLSTVVSNEVANSVSQKIKLFISPEIQIKPGSKITVTQVRSDRRLSKEWCTSSLCYAPRN